MNSDKPTTDRLSFKEAEAAQEQPEDFVGITRPIARRMSGMLPSRGPATENSSALPATVNGHSAAPAASEQRASAWTKYPSASASPPHEQQPPPESAVPPADTEATLATQAAAQQMWENHPAAESDQTASTTPPPDSPPAATTAATTSQPNLQAILSGLGNLTNQQALQLQELYLKTLKAVTTAAPTSKAPEAAPAEASEEKEQIPNKAQTPEASISRPRAERANPANGTLAILPEPNPRPASMPFSDAAHPLPQMPVKLPPPSPFHPPVTSAAAPAPLGTLGPHQVVELLGEMLRAQTAADAQPVQQTSLPQEQPPLVMNGSGISPYANLRYNSQDANGTQSFSQSLDPEAYKLAARRWNSCASMTSESSMYHAGGGFTQHNSLASLPQNLTNAETQALLQALQQKYQASEMESMANLTIQAILTGSANRDIHGLRKRKLPDVHEEQAKRHSSLLLDGENFQCLNGQQQICTECGTTSTPTWRRSGKRLMCNACGLRRSRSMRSARSASLTLNPQQSVGGLEHPLEEPAKMHAGV